jgi:hypothetical protein
VTRRHRTVRTALVALSVLAAAVTLGGCGASEDEKAAEALCSDFRWDPALSGEENSARMDAVMNRYEYEDFPDEIIDRARDQCRYNLAEYDRYTYGDDDDDDDDGGGLAEQPSEEPVDTSVQDFLASRGVTDDMVRQLGAMADLTGYGLDKDTPLPFDQAQDFASLIVSRVCDEVASGALTWEQSIAQDVATGAPVGDAQQMNGDMREVFCPQVT